MEVRKQQRLVRYGRRWLLLHRARACVRFVAASIKREHAERFVRCGNVLCMDRVELFSWRTQRADVDKCNRFYRCSYEEIVHHMGKHYHSRCSPICPVCKEVCAMGKWCACKRARMRPCQDCKAWRDRSDMSSFVMPGDEGPGFVCSACAVECSVCNNSISQAQAKFGGKCYLCNRKRKFEELGLELGPVCACGAQLKERWHSQCYTCWKYTDE